MSAVQRRLLVGGALADGSRADIAIDTASGVITGVGEVAPQAGDERVDCTGMVILASAVDPHAHLDKALSSRELAAMPATLADAVRDWIDLWPRLTHANFVERATEAVECMVAAGTTTIRSHVDIGSGVGLRAVNAIVEVRESMRSRGLADIQIVGLASPPLSGAAGADHRYLLDAAVDAGIDVIGGSPDLDGDPLGATTAAVDAAARAGLPLDLHMDQSIDPTMFWVGELARLVLDRGLTDVVASHCVSLANQPLDVQHATAELLAEAGIAVTTMPLSSLFYFGWDTPVAPPRGLTAISVLQQAGVVVAAGADNVQDVFFPLGRFDPFETAAVLAMAAHLSPAAAWEMCTTSARQAIGIPPVSVAPGSQADLVAIRARNLNEAVALASQHRIVLHAGRVVARTAVDGHLTC